MMNFKILCLGNEFIKEDSLAKRIGESLKNDFEIINIKDSFELLDYLQNENIDKIIILDVVKNLKKAKLLKIEDISDSKIITIHDFDSGFFIKLIGKNFKIIGIPIKGDFDEVKKEVKNLLREF